MIRCVCLGQTEIQQRQLTTRGQLHIVRVNISMNYLPIAAVEINQDIEQLICPRDHLGSWKGGGPPHNHLREVLARDKLHHDKRQAVFNKIIADARQRRMTKTREQPSFLFELSTQPLVK